MDSQVLGTDISQYRLRPEVYLIYMINDRAVLPLFGLFLFSSFRSLCAVLGTTLHTIGHALRVERTTDDVVTDARQVLHTAATDHNDGVLLKIVADTGDVCGYFVPIRETHTCDFPQSRVRLFGC